MITISIANNKGGVGKTTTTVSLGAALASLGKHVLLVDFDPQSSLTLYLGLDPNSLEQNVYHVFTKKSHIIDAIQPTHIRNLKILPASIELASAELEIAAAFGREFLLREQLKTLRDTFDFVIIDNMPSLGILTVNSLMASDYVIVPIEPTFLAYKGLEMISQTIQEISNYNQHLKLMGTIITMVDERTKHSKEVIANIRENYPVLEPLIKRSVKFADAAANGQAISKYAGEQFEGSQAYLSIAKSIIEKAAE